MPALDFTAWPSKPTAPPAVSPGAPRQTARAGAPKAGPKTGSSNSANGGFGELVDRLADGPDEGKAASAGVSPRRSRETVLDGEESAAEPRAKGDADGVSTANDAPVNLAATASNPPAFPWTLPLNPSLWNIEQVQVDDASAGETGDAIDGDSVIGAATTAIVDGAAGACIATLPGAGADAETSAAFTIPVEPPIAVYPGSTAIAAESAASLAESPGATDESATEAIDTFDALAWTDAAAAAGSIANAVGIDAAEAGDDLLATTNLAATAAMTNGSIGSFGVSADYAIDQSAASALTSNDFKDLTPVDPNDSALLAQSATDAATMAAVVEGAPATTAVGVNGQANAAIVGPLPGDQAREQALIELQRALESARGNAPATTGKHAANADAPIVIQTGASGANALDDAAAANAAANAAIDAAAANAADGSAATTIATTAAGEAGNSVGALASGASSRLRDVRQASEESSSDTDTAIAGASSWAAAAAAKYAEAAGAGTSSGDLRDSGSNADAAASIALAGRTGGETGNIAPIGFDARVIGATRADSAAASELPGGWTGEPIVTTAAPEDQASQIVRSMRLQWRGATGEATLRLQPDHLGQVFVSVRVENGAVSATVRAETPAAQQWIQQHQQQLRDALDAQGLRVAQFHVTSNPDDRPRRDHEQQQNQDETGRRSRGRARNNDAGDKRFEIRL